MGTIMILGVFLIVGVAIVLIVLAWQVDYELHDGPTDANWFVTAVLLALATSVLIYCTYLITLTS
jgi:hypothetical protein